MKPQQLFPYLGMTGAIAVLVARPVLAQVVQVTGIEVKQTQAGIDLAVNTADGSKPQISTSTERNTIIANISNAQLNLAGGSQFRSANPATGIAEVTAINLNTNTVQIRIRGTANVPKLSVAESTEPGLILSVQPQEQEINITVTAATRTEETIENISRSVTVIDRDQIEQQAEISTSRNLADILPKLVPGFGVSTQSPILNSSSGLRGRFPQVLIDGVPIKSNAFTSQARDLRTIDPSAIERIEVVRGPTAVYGDGGTGGVVNIITRQASEGKVTSSLEVGVDGSAGGGDSFLAGNGIGNNLQYGLSGTDGKFDYNLSLSRTDVGRFYDAEGDAIPGNDSDISESWSLGVLGKVGFNIDDNQRLELTLNHQNNQRIGTSISDPIVFDIPGTQKARFLEQPEPQPIGASRPEDITTILNLSYKNDDLGGNKFQTQIYYRDNLFRGTFFDGRPFDFTQAELSQSVFNRDVFGGRVQLETAFASNFSVLWGADYSQERNTFPINVFDTAEFDSSGGRVLRKTREISNPGNYRVNNLGLFGQFSWDISDNFLVNGGVRYERFGLSVDDYQTEEFGFIPNRDIKGGNLNLSDVVFNVGTVYKFTDKVSLFANFAQGFSAPDYSRILGGPPEGFTSVEDDLDITKPQKVNSYELGIRGNWSNVQASLAAFYNESELGLTIVPSVVGESDRVSATVSRQPRRIYGLEASLDWQPAKGWGIGGTLSLQDGELEDELGDFVALSSRDISPLKLTSYIQYETDSGWRNRLQALVVGGRDRGFDAGNDPVEINGYTTVDFISSVPLFNGRFSVSVENLFNQQYFPVLSQYFGGFDETLNTAGRGRTVRLGYSLNW